MTYIIKQNMETVWPVPDISAPASVYKIVYGGMGSSWEELVADCATGQEAIDLSDKLHYADIEQRNKRDAGNELIGIVGNCPKCGGSSPQYKFREETIKKKGRWDTLIITYKPFADLSCGDCGHSVSVENPTGLRYKADEARAAYQGVTQ